MNSKEVNRKKIFAITVLALFLISFSIQLTLAKEPGEADISGLAAAQAATNTNTADTNNPIEEYILKPVGKTLSEWENGSGFSNNFAKYLFWALVSMMVYSVAKKIPGIKNLFDDGKEWLGWTFAIIVGFLSMTLLNIAEINAMMLSYAAMGFVLGGFLPLIILLFFTIELATEAQNKSGAEQFGMRSIAVGMWIAFGIFLIYKISLGLSKSENVSGIYYFLVIIVIVAIISMKSIWKKIQKSLMEVKKDVAKHSAEIQNLVLTVDRDRYQAMSEK